MDPGAKEALDPELQKLLVCPQCKGELEFEPERILCLRCRLDYPVVEGIPVLLTSEARPLPP